MWSGSLLKDASNAHNWCDDGDLVVNSTKKGKTRRRWHHVRLQKCFFFGQNYEYCAQCKLYSVATAASRDHCSCVCVCVSLYAIKLQLSAFMHGKDNVQRLCWYNDIIKENISRFNHALRSTANRFSFRFCCCCCFGCWWFRFIRFVSVSPA